MKHNYYIDGYSYRLRPVVIDDAEFIIELRNNDERDNQYVHAISGDVDEEKAWIESYYTKTDEVFFVIENKYTNKPEGTIGLTSITDRSAEWGRWFVSKKSLSAIESVLLIYRIAFEQIGLNELYCRTSANNKPVVQFHDSIGEKYRKTHKDMIELDGIKHDAVEHFAEYDYFYEEVLPYLEARSIRIQQKNLHNLLGEFSCDHIGIATKSIKKEIGNYYSLGYSNDGSIFVDEFQGIKGQFIKTYSGGPRLELLENLEGSNTLDRFLSGGTKMYHIAFCVNDIEGAITCFKNAKAKVISELKTSSYFGKRICFMVFPNMQIIELIER